MRINLITFQDIVVYELGSAFLEEMKLEDTIHKKFSNYPQLVPVGDYKVHQY